jgi:hypothetical protein
VYQTLLKHTNVGTCQLAPLSPSADGKRQVETVWLDMQITSCVLHPVAGNGFVATYDPVALSTSVSLLFRFVHFWPVSGNIRLCLGNVMMGNHFM